MNRIAATALLAGLAVLGGASFLGVTAATRAGEFTTLQPRFDGTCVTAGGLPGAEDMALDRASGQLFVSSDDRRAEPARRGAIYMLPFATLESVSARTDATVGVPERFHPHGVSLWTGPDGARRLFVINHPDGWEGAASTVEIYDVAPEGTLRHVRTVSDPAFSRLNDIVADGPESFFVTRETLAARNSAGELWGQLSDTDRTGAVLRYAGGQVSEAATGFSFANSLALSPDAGRLYASDTIARTVRVYGRDAATGGLTQIDAAQLGTGVDNLDVEPDGRVWIAAHPKLMTFAFGHARDASVPAPSQVIILEPDPSGKGGRADQVLLTNDGAYSGASVAIRNGQRLVLGSVFEPGVRVCTLPDVWKHSVSAPVRSKLEPSR